MLAREKTSVRDDTQPQALRSTSRLGSRHNQQRGESAAPGAARARGRLSVEAMHTLTLLLEELPLNGSRATRRQITGGTVASCINTRRAQGCQRLNSVRPGIEG